MASVKNNQTDSLPVRMSAREDEAFQEFFDYFTPQFRTMFMAKGMHVAEAEELAISCASDIALKVERYEPREESSFDAWVFTIARNIYAELFKDKEKPRLQALPETLVAPEPVEKNVVREAKIVEAVQEALEQLSETDKLIIQLRYFGEDRSFKEIGEVLGIAAGTARTRHHRAVKNAEKILKDDERITALLRKITTPAREANENDGTGF